MTRRCRHKSEAITLDLSGMQVHRYECERCGEPWLYFTHDADAVKPTGEQTWCETCWDAAPFN